MWWWTRFVCADGMNEAFGLIWLSIYSLSKEARGGDQLRSNQLGRWWCSPSRGQLFDLVGPTHSWQRHLEDESVIHESWRAGWLALALKKGFGGEFWYSKGKWKYIRGSWLVKRVWTGLKMPRLRVCFASIVFFCGSLHGHLRRPDDGTTWE